MSEQNNTLIVKGTEHPEERLPLYKSEQKKLIPELGNILDRLFGMRPLTVEEVASQIIALIEPLIKDAKKQEREKIIKEIEGYKGSYIDARFLKSKFWQALKREK